MTGWTVSQSFSTEYAVGAYILKQRLERVEGTHTWSVLSQLIDDAGEVMAERLDTVHSKNLRTAKALAEHHRNELTAFANEKTND